MKLTRRNMLTGAIIYASGDTIASLITHEFLLSRFVGLILIGGLFYAFEIPNYFDWIAKKTGQLTGWQLTLSRTGLALLYFNPLWIARHLALIKIFSGAFNDISFGLLNASLKSFLFNIPVSFIANFIIQNKIALKYRFIASAIFSGLMAIYYALSLHWFT